MSVVPPEPGSPRRPGGPRDPGDAWVVAPSGERYWGRFGAAGLLAVDASRGVLLQHRVGWSHFGGTWGLPGGARHEGESATDGALRESHEEAGVPPDAVRPRFASVADRQVWTYTTLVADVVTAFEPVIGDAESLELAWVPVGEVEERPLHPGFALAWPMLRDLLAVRPTVVVDVANVMGSVPDGWWKDRVGAASRLLARLAAWADAGTPAAALELPGDHWFPRVVAVVEGQLRAAGEGQLRAAGEVRGIEVVRAVGSGDDAIVQQAAALAGTGASVTVVTADRELADRVGGLGAVVRGPRWLRELLPV